MASGAPQANIDVGRVMSRAFTALGRNFLPFAGVALLLGGIPVGLMEYALLTVLPDTGLSAAALDWTYVGIAFLVSSIAGNLLTAILVRSSILYLEEDAADVGGSLAMALRLLLPMIGLSILVSIIISAGLILLIVPGIIFAVALSVAAPVLLVERRGIVDSLHRSAELTRGSRWWIFLLFILYGLLSFFVGTVLNLAVGNDPSEGDAAVGALVQTVAATVTGLIYAVVIASLYVELRTIKEGTTMQRLAAIFE